MKRMRKETFADGVVLQEFHDAYSQYMLDEAVASLGGNEEFGGMGFPDETVVEAVSLARRGRGKMVSRRKGCEAFRLSSGERLKRCELIGMRDSYREVVGEQLMVATVHCCIHSAHVGRL